MKIGQRLAAILAATFVLSGCFPILMVKAGQPSEETITTQDDIAVNDVEITEDTSSPETTAMPEETAETAIQTDFPLPDEAPMFQAHIEFHQGYTVIGAFTDFTPDICRIQTLYSLDGEIWQTGEIEWNLFTLGTDDETKLPGLQNQPCLLDFHEPLKSYIAGEIDRFYLKLRITKENGLSYETQSAVIERGGIQPIPEEIESVALFSSAIAAREPIPDAPHRYRRYGRYQLTVYTDATAEEISALLPDTLPVEIQLIGNDNFNAICVIDCPVTWKPLSLPALPAGESITIADAAEEILVPEGTLLSTPLGTFQLDEALGLNTDYSTDEIRLVLNVSPEDRNPTGVLREGKNGLEMAFYHNPTGAVSIQTYVLAEGDSQWTELPGLPQPEDLNQPSTANSGYALVLRNNQEPYRSYLAATAAGETPTPFFIGVRIEGGIYNDRQLILTWPDIYEQLPDLPEIVGAGGNEGNAGADNKKDSTEDGQRPDLPQTSETGPAISESRNASSADGSVTVPEEKDPISGQSDPIQQEPDISESSQILNLPQTTQDTADASSAKTAGSTDQKEGRTIERFDSSVLPPLVVQVSTNIGARESAAVLSNAETTATRSAADNRHIPLLPAATAIITLICIAAAYKAAGSGLFIRIAAKIRNTLHH